MPHRLLGEYPYALYPLTKKRTAAHHNENLKGRVLALKTGDLTELEVEGFRSVGKKKDYTGLAGELSIAAYKVVEALSAVWNWIDRMNRRNRAIRELSRLDDHMLKDIGMHRGEIREVVEAGLDAPAPRPVAPPEGARRRFERG